MCFGFSIGSFVAVIVMSIRAAPDLSVVWLLWFLSTAAYPLLGLPSSFDVAVDVNKPMTHVPMQTVLIQHPDGTLHIDSKSDP